MAAPPIFFKCVETYPCFLYILHHFRQDCDDFTGECKCDAKNYQGSACGIYCPNACSNHGTCGQKQCTVDIAKENIPPETIEAAKAKNPAVTPEMLDCKVIGQFNLCCEESNGQLAKEFCCATCAGKTCPSTTPSPNSTGK